MKFAKELERDLVPEWRIKYLNYKAGKKYIKAVSRAIYRANGTPRIGRRVGDLPPHLTPKFLPNGLSPFARRASNSNDGNGNETSSDDGEEMDPLRTSPAPIAGTGASRDGGRPLQQKKKASRSGVLVPGERASLTKSPSRPAQYGSFPSSRLAQQSTPAHSKASGGERSADFELPAPALRVPSHISDSAARPSPHLREPALSRLAMQRSSSMMAETGPRRSLSPVGPPHHSSTVAAATSSAFESPRQRLVRLLSVGAPLERHPSSAHSGVDLRSLDEVRERETDFYRFLDGELDKVETFYQQKEDQAGVRLDVLRTQLHEMRDRRSDELAERKRLKERGHSLQHEAKQGNGATSKHVSWMDPLRARILKVGPNSKALNRMAWTPMMAGSSQEDGRDYTRRPTDPGVPYRTAKRKLKLALQEFYRGLELLKSYALLNRTAFRKLNKKYDKAVNARPPLRYLNEKVNKAWFVRSDVLDNYITTVEDLYARYFEGGNHKVAAGKLRKLGKRDADASGSAFRNGLMIGIGAVFAVQGLTYGSELLFAPDPTMSLQTSYLLQLYGGYFLMLYLFGIFCLDCFIWKRNKVNYPFIFEFDPRHHLDWRQLAEFPSFFLMLFGVVMWLNFTQVGPDWLYLWYPVLLISLSLAILCFPAPILGHRSRRWFLYSHYRLLLAGLYPVEFRDFFLGDIYCSLTYATANVELYFCLYATLWGDPTMCNSNHSRLLGFFTALPGIWRALQCLRRYRDTRNLFPHLVNCGKYAMTILSYVALSLYRIRESRGNLALFITFSAVNGVYCSVWDLFMDFSLLQPNSRHRLLRDVLALDKQRWVYYGAMVLDPVLRFAWVFYAIFTHDAQHSTIVAFMAGFAEVTRRGMWTLFRVENEHCANVAQYKASRDVPLPYRIEPLVERVSLEEEEAAAAAGSAGGGGGGTGKSAPGVDVAASAAGGRTPRTPVGVSGRTSETVSASVSDPVAPHASAVSTGAAPAAAAAAAANATPGEQETGLRRRRTETMGFGARSIRGIMAMAHKQDYEKKRRPADGSEAGHAGLRAEDDAGRSDEDDDEEEEEEDEEMEMERDEDAGERHTMLTATGGRGDQREAEQLVRGVGDEEESERNGEGSGSASASGSSTG